MPLIFHEITSFVSHANAIKRLGYACDHTYAFPTLLLFNTILCFKMLPHVCGFIFTHHKSNDNINNGHSFCRCSLLICTSLICQCKRLRHNVRDDSLNSSDPEGAPSTRVSSTHLKLENYYFLLLLFLALKLENYSIFTFLLFLFLDLKLENYSIFIFLLFLELKLESYYLFTYLPFLENHH